MRCAGPPPEPDRTNSTDVLHRTTICLTRECHLPRQPRSTVTSRWLVLLHAVRMVISAVHTQHWSDINIQWCISQTQQNFIMFIIVLGQRVSILIELPSGPSKTVRFCIFEGPEDFIGIEACCPNTIINLIKFCCF